MKVNVDQKNVLQNILFCVCTFSNVTGDKKETGGRAWKATRKSMFKYDKAGKLVRFFSVYITEHFELF